MVTRDAGQQEKPLPLPHYDRPHPRHRPHQTYPQSGRSPQHTCRLRRRARPGFQERLGRFKILHIFTFLLYLDIFWCAYYNVCDYWTARLGPLGRCDGLNGINALVFSAPPAPCIESSLVQVILSSRAHVHLFSRGFWSMRARRITVCFRATSE